jgi:hypothetical protein
MTRYLVLACFWIIFLTAPAAADNSGTTQVTQGGLTCFSMVTKPEGTQRQPSCDEQCGAKGAACTAVTTDSGAHYPMTCASNLSTFFAVCQCCAISR